MNRSAVRASVTHSLSRAELDALVAIMPAWMHQREWLPPQGSNPTLLWNAIDRQGLGGALGSLAVANLMPEGELGELAKARYISNMLRSQQANILCRKIQYAARGLEIPIINFKGPALVSQAYSDQGIRAFADLDMFASSRAEVFRLLNALGAKIDEDTDKVEFSRRLRAPGRVLATLDGWEIEIRYPAREATDPMLDLLYRFDFASINAEDDCLIVPDPAWHLVLLVMHLSWYHYYARFVWLMDLAALVSRCRDRIDMDWAYQECGRLRSANLLAIAGRYCRMNIDDTFPEFPVNTRAWNYKFLCTITTDRMICSEKYSLHKRTALGNLLILWFRIVRFYLLADPLPRYSFNSPPERWMIATFVLGIRSTRASVRFVAGLLAHYVLLPLSRISAFIASKYEEVY